VTDVPGSTDKLVLYTPNPPLSPSSNHIAGLVYAGTTNFWIFNVIAFTNVAAADVLASSVADPNAAGFHVKVVQAAAARPGGNTAAAAETQLAAHPPTWPLTDRTPTAVTQYPGSSTGMSQRIQATRLPKTAACSRCSADRRTIQCLGFLARV